MLIKSLLISRMECLNGEIECADGAEQQQQSIKLILFTNNKPAFDEIKSTVFQWDQKFTKNIHLMYIPTEHPSCMNQC